MACIVITPLDDVTNVVEVEYLPNLKFILGEIEPKVLSNLGASLYARQLAIHLNVSCHFIIYQLPLLVNSNQFVLIILSILVYEISSLQKSTSVVNVRVFSTRSLMFQTGLSA